MNWLNKLERKIGRYAVPNLIIWLIGAYTIGFVFRNVSPGILNYLTLSPYHILHGQIWRLVTWVFMPTDSNLIFLTDHGIVLLSAWHGTGTYLGNFPV